MGALPESLQRLVGALGQLPGIGPRTAERLALHLVQREPEAVKLLAAALVEAREKVQACAQCGGLTEIQPCALCADPRRDAALLCVVETPVDILRLEKAGAYRGLYHVLGGRLSPTTGVEPEDLRIAELEARLAEGRVKEVVLALGSDVESDATCYYLARRLAGQGVPVTRLAQGLPAGAGLEFADEITLSRALEGRRRVE
ncbi:recombination mediator RecR [Fontisphaera persica]|uniref:recombination mediator RecR n=1 Tax=Fontisphaera persica TaxID=2974023 RepID=UPI0024C0E08A|nr:recombination mediator RecR [Fontisphaera persica]WCJ57939.1 recombination mediator RecR [Fontisphaera persica]